MCDMSHDMLHKIICDMLHVRSHTIICDPTHMSHIIGHSVCDMSHTVGCSMSHTICDLDRTHRSVSG